MNSILLIYSFISVLTMFVVLNRVNDFPYYFFGLKTVNKRDILLLILFPVGVISGVFLLVGYYLSLFLIKSINESRKGKQ